MLKALLITWFLSCLLGLASAGIFGTSPVASTVWSAGRSERVTWVDDKRAPSLENMGKLDIDLLTGDEVCIFVHEALYQIITVIPLASRSDVGQGHKGNR